MSVTGEGIVVWDGDGADYCAIVTPATEPWEIRCEDHAIRTDAGWLREGARVRVEYVPDEAGGFRWRATNAWLLPYDPALLDPIVRDAAAPPVSWSREQVVRLADHQWPYCAGDDEYFVDRIIEELQQEMHDLFIDTEWPACPRHPNHPMWYGAGYWRCATDKAAIVALGELAQLRGS